MVCGVIDILSKTTSCLHHRLPLSRKDQVKRNYFCFSSVFNLSAKLMAGSACFPARPLQCFPRLRASAYARNGERKENEKSAKRQKFCVSRLGLMFAICCQDECLLKACASRQEKTPACNENSAPPNTHIRDLRLQGAPNGRFSGVFEARAEKNIARPQHFNALA